MKIKKLNNGFIFLISIYLTSCVSQGKMEYLNDHKDMDTYEIQEATERKIKPNDELYIRVSSFDEVAFNFFGNQMENRSMGMSDQSISLISYNVNSEGYIYFPILGEVLVKDLTLLEATDKLKKLLSEYFNQPTVLIKLVNKQVSILGEVKGPGYYTYTKNNISILQAISMAGDITDLGDRKTVILLRETNGKLLSVDIDITNSDFVNSPYYFVKPGDIIYVKPVVSAKWLKTNTSTYQLLLTSITTFLLILNYIK